MKVVSVEQFDLRREVDYGTPEQNDVVKRIVHDVKTGGDEALLRYTQELDHAELTAVMLRVTKEELEAAYDQVEDSFVQAISAAASTTFGRSICGRSATHGWTCSPTAAFWGKSSGR